MFVRTATAQMRDTAALRAELLLEQRVELKKMTKAVCFVLAGSDRSLLSRSAIAAADRFDRSLAQLVTEDLAAETDSERAKALSELDAQARAVTLSARQIIAGDVHRVPMSLLLDDGADVGRALVTLSASALSLDKDKPGSTAAAHTMLTLIHQSARMQAMLRDACLNQVGLLGERGHDRMMSVQAEFEADLAALQTGDPDRNILAPPNVTARVLLGKVAAFWDKSRDTLVTASLGENVEIRALQKASIYGDLMDMNLKRARKAYMRTPPGG
ncbi:hypothetical protein [Sulfitobacter aestuariivivens]|uniref:Uncharacterized protein n=1 Tax=Sulfitobacter aestuariivivens TaxID=2766981 RepID=A0A927D387_9RHOB|nr:hypothetical protein [Sulfitobacter aestuariivivens]MBD3664320.1 hypothetical protein [Sulfitobacter aestuariivivens]